MNTEKTLAQLRNFLRALSIALCGGTIIELWLGEHTQQALQWVPFGLSALGILLGGWAWARPGKASLGALRAGMTLLVLGSVLGIYFHLHGNFSFIKEIQPNTAFGTALWGALQGVAPLLAPGILGLAGVLAWAAYYRIESR